MSRAYKILAPPLHATADAAEAWFIKNWGLTAAMIGIEEPIDPDISLRPTFSTRTQDFHTLCIEVSESIYPNYLDAFVLDCRNKGMPVKLFIAVQKGKQDPEYAQRLKAAKRAGVGILEVDNKSGTVIENPLSLSLTGVRPIEITAFQKKYRQSLLQAEQTFKDGNPPKACGVVFDELESRFRLFAKKTESNGWWTNPGLDLDKAPWASILTHIDQHLNRSACNCPDLTPAFMARIHGVIPFRNESGHKPRNAKALKKRDQELRTRFEAAVDLFRDFTQATKKLKL